MIANHDSDAIERWERFADNCEGGPFDETFVRDLRTLLALAKREHDAPDVEVKIMSYDHSHEDAVALGYPSVLEALEDLERLKAKPPPGCEHKAVAGPCSICGDMG